MRFAPCASTMSAMGRPTSRAHTQATELPRLPLGMMYDGASPVRRQSFRLLAA